MDLKECGGKSSEQESMVEIGWRNRGLQRLGDHMIFFIVRAQLSN